MEREPTNRREDAKTTPEEPRAQAQGQEDEDLTKNYVTCHEDFASKTSPELVDCEAGEESGDESSDAEG